MKQALRSIFGLALAGFLFSTGITMFEQVYSNVQNVMVESSQFTFNA